MTASLLGLRHPLRFALDADDVPRRGRYGQTRMAIFAHAHLLVVPGIDNFHVAVADGTTRDGWLRVSPSPFLWVLCRSRHSVSTLLHQA